MSEDATSRGPGDDVGTRLDVVLAGIPEPQRREVAEGVREVIAARSFRGPLPPPALLKGYEEVVPGFAARIVDMAEREQAHRHRWEDRALAADRWYALLGLVAGWTTAIGLALGAAVVGIYGHWSVGVALAAASATGMVWKLVQGRSDQPEEQAARPAPEPADKPGEAENR